MARASPRREATPADPKRDSHADVMHVVAAEAPHMLQKASWWSSDVEPNSHFAQLPMRIAAALWTAAPN